MEQTTEQLQALLRERRFGVFARLWNQTVQQNGPSAHLYRLWVDYGRLTGSVATVREALKQWIRLEPTNQGPFLQLADLLDQQGNNAAALEVLEIAEQSGNRTPEVSLCKVRLAILTQQFADAATYAKAGLEVAGEKPVATVLLRGLCMLAGNLQAVAGRAELGGMVQSVVSRAAKLQADANGLYLNFNGAARRLRHADREPGLTDELTSQIKSRSCGCIIGSADVLDLAGPAARVHDGSFWGSRSRVYVVECDEDMLALALARFDVRDVLTDEAVTWVWGPTALEQLERCLLEREEEPPQNITVSSDPQVAPVVDKASQAFHHKVEALFRESSAYYASLPREHWGDIFGGSPSRPPRILLITTEFSSFIKFSIRDLASAFERMGWQVQVAKESQPTHRMTGVTVPKAVATFRPDLIWQINYMRNAWKGTIPDGVPFVCWDQDKMPHMLSQTQAATMGRSDFLAHLGSGVDYISRYAYQVAQMVPLSMCIDRSIFYPSSSGRPPMDVSFVSHHGWSPAQRVDSILADAGDNQVVRQIMLRYAEQTDLQMAQSGDPIVLGDSDALLRRVCQEHRVELDAATWNMLSHYLHRVVANAVWRQQAVRWVTACGVDLRLYGLGWERNSEFACFAAGVVEHGEPLRKVFVSSKVALQAVLAGNEHQRLWEAAASGTVVLMRYHPADETFVLVRKWMDRLDKAAGQPLADTISVEERNTLVGQWTYRSIQALTGSDDLLNEATLQCVHRMAETPSLRDRLRGIYDEVTFHNQAELASKLSRVLSDDAYRQYLREKFLEVSEELTYDQLLPRVIQFVRQRLMQ